MKKKVLLVSVLTEKNAIITEEVGMCSIASYLESKGCDVSIINSSRNYLDYQKIYELKPDIIGFPVYSTTEQIVINVCEKIKEKLPNAEILFGGYWPTQCPEYLMKKHSIIDYIILGEGEIATYNLIESLENDLDLSDVKSLVYRKGSQILINEREKLIENLDELPFAKRDLLKNNLLRYAYISTSRGCNANCAFCWHNRFWNASAKTQWRGRSVESVMHEIKQIVNQYGVTRFWFIDDSFEDHDATCPDRMFSIAKGIIDHKLDIAYETYMRAEVYKRMDDEKIRLLKDSGFVGLIFGIESGNEEDLRLYRKIAKVEDNYKGVEYFRNHGIAVDIGFINFNPYSTPDKLKQNLEYLEKTKFASVLYYIVERCGITKFSSLYKKVEEDGLLIKDDENQCYSYHYVDANIEKLSDYLYFKYHANENSKEYFYAKKIGSYIREEFKLLNYVKRKFRHQNNVIQLITDSESIAWQILDEVNSVNAQCFRELIELIEGKWSEQAADGITERYLNLNDIKKKSNQLEQNRLALYMKLTKAGVDPSEYFNI
ncbi:B12-binding domain-containing radical SAM protein [Clostridia bacterium]|nr:B12-binding domain-containing radical SAM protein [Clostridia bacterium]